MRRLALALAALVLSLMPILVLTGCGERSEPTSGDVSLFPVTVAGADGATASLARSAKRVAVLGAGPAAVVEALGHEAVRLDTPSGQLDPSAFGDTLPDLLIIPGSADRSFLDKSPTEFMPIYAMPDRSLEDIEKALVDVSLLLGDPLAGRKAAQKIATARSRLASRLASAKVTTIFLDRGRFSTVADASFIGSLLREAKTRSVAGPAPNEGPIDLGELIRAQPDVYLATSTSGRTLAELRKHRRLKRLHAIAEGRFFTIPIEDLTPGPGAVRALELIARATHPDAFA